MNNKKQNDKEIQLLEDEQKNIIKNLLFSKNINQKVKIIKCFYKDVGVTNNFEIFDVSFKKKGPQEDKIYKNNPLLISYMRRGMTFLLNNDFEPKVQIIRRGLPKFFDLEKAYIEENLLHKQNNKLKSSFYSEKIKKIIFDKIKDSLYTSKIRLYRLEKANGENCQISYNDKIKCYLISSKNVCLPIENESQLKSFTINEIDSNQTKALKQRFKFPLLMAESWFNLLNNLKKKNPLIEFDLKKELNEKTLIGEYCGNLNHQHLVKYPEIQIKFYAIVDLNKNKENELCIPLEESYNFFKKYDLPTVNKIDSEIFDNFLNLNEKLLLIYKQNFLDEGEGNVLYFVKIDKNNKEIEVLNLCKIKTLKYRLLRKLREKLKSFISSGKINKEDFYTIFLKKFNDMSELEIDPDIINYYKLISEKAFEFLLKNFKGILENSFNIHDNFVIFIESIISSIEQKYDLNLEKLLKNKEIYSKKIILNEI